MLEPMLLVDEVAEILKVDKQEVYRMVRNGMIPHIRVGKRVRFPQEQLRKWIEEGGCGYDRIREREAH